MSRWVKERLSSAFSRVKNVSFAVSSNRLSISRPPAAKSVSSAATHNTTNEHYVAKVNERFSNDRYEAVKPLGSGKYSRVWLARDLQQKSLVALKILSKDCYGGDHDIFEIEILQTIARRQTQLEAAGGAHVLGLTDSFQLTSPGGTHECIVLPVLGCSLSAQISRFPDRRIPLLAVKHITRQLLMGLAFLHERCRVVHTDLQPSNICFELGSKEIEEMAAGRSADEVTPTISNESPGKVKIIDFGVSSWIEKHLSDNIQPEHLRAPEVILGAPWGPPIDIWSLGCLVIEFVKGHLAFFGEASKKGTWTSNDDHLAQHMEVLGPMPRSLLDSGSKTQEYFDNEGSLLRIPQLKPTSLKELLDGDEWPFRRPSNMSAEEVLVFIDFLQGALALDPQLRKTAADLLQHEWLQEAT